MKSQEIDEWAEAKKGPSDNQLKMLSKIIDEAQGIQEELEAFERGMKALKDELNILLLKKIPEQMDECGISTFTCSNGLKVETKMAVDAKFPNAEKEPQERERILKLLAPFGIDDLIKPTLSLTFAQGEDEKLESVIGLLKESGKELNMSLKQDVNAATMKAWLKEQLSGGARIPIDKCGWWYGKKATISVVKAKK